MKLTTLVCATALIALAGCAKSTNEIQAQYISPLEYQDYNCKQMQMEMRSLSRRVSDISAQVNKTASDDSAQMGVGLILFWPTLFFLDGDTPQAQEYARLQGQFNALEEAAIQKECGFEIERPIIQRPEQNNRRENQARFN